MPESLSRSTRGRPELLGLAREVPGRVAQRGGVDHGFQRRNQRVGARPEEVAMGEVAQADVVRHARRQRVAPAAVAAQHPSQDQAAIGLDRLDRLLYRGVIARPRLPHDAPRFLCPAFPRRVDRRKQMRRLRHDDRVEGTDATVQPPLDFVLRRVDGLRGLPGERHDVPEGGVHVGHSDACALRNELAGELVHHPRSAAVIRHIGLVHQPTPLRGVPIRGVARGRHTTSAIWVKRQHRLADARCHARPVARRAVVIEHDVLVDFDRDVAVLRRGVQRQEREPNETSQQQGPHRAGVCMYSLVAPSPVALLL